MSDSVTVVVLAAGKGTRMKSPRPKVLHRLAGRSMIHHVLAVAAELEPRRAVVVLYGDTPLLTPATLRSLLEARRGAGAAVAVLGMRPPDPRGYGRLAFAGGELAAIVEERHADAALKADGLCNAGIMAFDAARLGALLDALELRTPKNEYYLTDAVGHARARGWPCAALEAPWLEAIGVNSQAQLAEAEAVFQDRPREGGLGGGGPPVRPRN